MKSVWMFLLLLGFPDSFSHLLGNNRELKLVNEWRSIDYNFPNENLRQDAIQRRQFVPGQPVPIDIDVHYKAPNLPLSFSNWNFSPFLGSVAPTSFNVFQKELGSDSRVFITTPRFRDGIPVTLGTRSTARAADGSVLIDPYPDYSWHQNPTQDCNNKMVSVFRVAIDECERLWVMDTGKIGLSTSPQVCPPKILVFNLNTNQLVHRYVIPQSQYNQNSLFITPVVDVLDPAPGFCLQNKAYIADVAGFGILVYDAMTDSSWRVENNLFRADPAFSTHTISGESFFLADGIFGLAIDKNNKPNRNLYFHALAAQTENSVPLDVLNDRFAWETNRNSYPQAFQVLGPRGTQSAASALDSNENLFFGLNGLNEIACWDTTKRPYNRGVVRTLVKDNEKLQFASGVKVKRNTEGEEELWTLTNRFQKVSAGTMNTNEVNFRIQAQRVSQLLNGPKCL